MKALLKLLLTFTVIATFYAANGQTYKIPDPAFKNYLKEYCPWVLDANGDLDIKSAKWYQGAISCQGKGIKDLSGLQYFHNIYLINCTKNELETLPSLDSLKKLKYLWTNNNHLIQLPSLDNLDSLEVLDIKQNNLSSIPNLSQLSKLYSFDCSNNKIKILPGLGELRNLKILYCYNNLLTYLPDLNNLNKLETLDCQINNLNDIPDLSTNTSLRTLKVANNRLTKLPSLSNQTALIELVCNNNLLTSFPDIQNCLNLRTILITHNQFTFEDLIPLLSHPNYSENFVMNPQDTIIKTNYLSIKENQRLTLNTGIDGSLNSNTYRWYKNKEFIGSTDINNYLIEKASLNDQGDYLCQVKNLNPEFTDFSLWVDFGKLAVTPCFSINNINYTIVNNDCEEGISIKIDDTGLNASSPVYYQLIPKTGQKEASGSTTNFEGLSAGVYDLRIKDMDECQATFSDYIKLPAPSGCEKTFTPNGDGIDDAFYIEKPGSTKIYSKEGKLVKELFAPAYWNGTDQTGNLVPMGYYIIVIEEREKIGVVLLN